MNVRMSGEFEVDAEKINGGMVMVYRTDFDFLLKLIPEEAKRLISDLDIVPDLIELALDGG